MGDIKNSDSKENEYPSNHSPVLSSKSKSQPQFEMTPSSSHSGALKTKNLREMCFSGKDLPSNSISDLWQKPLKKVSSPLRPVNSPKGRAKLWKNVLPPTRLHFDHCSDSEDSPISRVKQTKGCRRSLSVPTESTNYDSEASLYACPKRLKRFAEETSPYEDLVGDENKATSSTLTPAVKNLFVKSPSDSALLSRRIKSAVEVKSDNPHLIGDGSKSYILPVKEDGKHPDLKEITCETLAELLRAEGNSDTVNFKIIDCRYPYEYNGGHIKGALNLYSKRQLREELLDSKTAITSPSTSKDADSIKAKESREILIFHCEFSSRRGPDCCRYVRQCDRKHNLSNYPDLFYPELYILFGGYKEFFSKFPSLCEPVGYVPMDDKTYADEYRRFKSEAKLV